MEKVRGGHSFKLEQIRIFERHVDPAKHGTHFDVSKTTRAPTRRVAISTEQRKRTNYPIFRALKRGYATCAAICAVAMMITGCAIQPSIETQMRVVSAKSAYGLGPDPQLACRLLRASRCTYAITDTNTLEVSHPQYPACLDDSLDRKIIVDQTTKINAALIELTPDSVIIAYRGTLPLDDTATFRKAVRDWIEDAKAQFVEVNGIPGKIHRGFYGGYAQTIGGVMEVINGWAGEGKLAGRRIYITGHSKGGAMAIIGGAALNQTQFKPSAIYTFAAPRAGDADFAKGYGAAKLEVWRFENSFDVVPHVPPNAAEDRTVDAIVNLDFHLGGDDYQSLGNLLFIQSNGAVTADYQGLSEYRKKRIEQAIDESPDAVIGTVIRAHSSASSGGYDRAICRDVLAEVALP